MKTSILTPAIGVALGCPTTAYGNIIEELFFGSASAQRTPMSARHDFVFAARHPNHERFTQQNFRLSC
jgi:hypothetical protein